MTRFPLERGTLGEAGCAGHRLPGRRDAPDFWTSATLIAGRTLLEHALQALEEGVVMSLVFGQDGGQIAGTLGIADRFEDVGPG